MRLFPHDDTRPETLRQVYQATRTLLDTPARWTREAWAMTSTGMVCPALSAEAWCYCITGGLFRVLNVDPFSLQVGAGDREEPEASPLTAACLIHLAETIGTLTQSPTWRELVGRIGWDDAIDELTLWNDVPERTITDVHQLLDMAIATLPDQEAP